MPGADLGMRPRRRAFEKEECSGEICGGWLLHKFSPKFALLVILKFTSVIPVHLKAWLMDCMSSQSSPVEKVESQMLVPNGECGLCLDHRSVFLGFLIG